MTTEANTGSGSSDYTPGLVVALKYRLLRRLGEGGMAAVWVAHSEALDIDVAIKFIRGDVKHANMHLGGRLLQEARAAARLGHPAIVRVFDFGTTDRGDPFIVMELLNGEDLGTALKHRGRLAAVKAVRTLLPIAHALATAHEKGIVHRDLKPENIFLAQNEDGVGIQPKLVDFGVAKLEHAGFERLTDLGTAIGSPGYMSPEQARGLDVDHRTDIWALCVALYETVTGRLPFDGKSYNALLRSIIEDTPLPITNFAAGDSALWEILSKGLAKKVEDRWQSMRDVGQALAKWLLARGCNEDIAGGSLQAAWIAWRPRNTLPPSARASYASIAPTDTIPPKSAGADSTAKTAAVGGPTTVPPPTPISRASELTHTPPAGAEPYIPASERESQDEIVIPTTKRRGPLVFGVILLLLAAVGGFLAVSQIGKKTAPEAASATPAPPKTEIAPKPEPPKLEAPKATTELAPSETPRETPSASAPAATAGKEKKPKAAAGKAAPPPTATDKKLEIKTTF